MSEPGKRIGPPSDAPFRMRAAFAVTLWLGARSVHLRRILWKRTTRESAFVHRYLDGLRGVEIGASAHNDYGVDAINVDRFASLDTVYKRSEYDLCGRIRPVDMVAPGDDLPFRDDAVDFVLSSHVIEHFPDPIGALKEWVRVARRYVVVVAPHRDRTFDHTEPLTPLSELIERHERGFADEEDRHWSVFTSESFLELCRAVGLEVIDHQDPDDKVGNGFTVVLGAAAPAEQSASAAHQPASA